MLHVEGMQRQKSGQSEHDPNPGISSFGTTSAAIHASSFVSLRGNQVPLTWAQKWSYSVGHVLNDLCAGCWFSYLLVYMENSVGIDKTLAGVVMLAGQLMDGIATPVVGMLSDKSEGCCKLGKRKSWNVFGAIGVAIFFTLTFGPPFVPPKSIQVVYFCTSAALFNACWASSQISHLTLVPELTDQPEVRTGLYTKRYAFTVLSNMTVFGIFALFTAIAHGSQCSDNISRSVFQDMAYAIVALGIFSTLLFACGTQEHVLCDTTTSNGGTDHPDGATNAWKQWLRRPSFWIAASCYMFARLATNCSQVFIPFVLLKALNAPCAYVALVPFEVYFGSLLATVIMKPLTNRLGKDAVYCIGTIPLTIGAGMFIAMMQWNMNLGVVHLPAVLIGIGTSIIIVMSTGVQADLIGKVQSQDGNGFVYGFCSMTDKVSNGVSVIAIQSLREHYPDSENIILSSTFAGIIVITWLGGVCLIVLWRMLQTGETRANLLRAGSA